MKIETIYGDAELVVSTRIDAEGNTRTNCTDLMFGGERVRTFINHSLEQLESLSEDKKELLIEKCHEVINEYMERKEDERIRNNAINTIKEMGAEEVYKFIVSLHSCEGAAQMNLYDFVNKIR